MSKRQIARTINDQVQQWRALYQTITEEMVLRETIDVQQIPAPTFDEGLRVDYLEKRFKAMDFDMVERDDMGNVYGWLGRVDCDHIVVVSAHHDTVFPMETDLTVRETGTRVYGPGMGDNSLGVSALLILAQHLGPQLKLEHISLCLLANSREEGLGNLDGIRVAIEHIGAARIRAGIVLEGMALGRVYHGGIAVRRLKVCASAEGGHSWMSFGQPSAIHGLVQLAADITKLDVPKEPRTTYNIGVIEGGQSVNSIATDAHFMLDMRSSDPDALQDLDNRVRRLIKLHQTLELDFEFKVVGERPAGHIERDHPLVQLALRSLYEIGIAGILEHGSTDANMFLSQGIPAVVVGVSYGGNAHRLDEFIDRSHLKIGMWQLILLVTSVISAMEENQSWD